MYLYITFIRLQDAHNTWRLALAGADLTADLDVLLELRDCLERADVAATHLPEGDYSFMIHVQ